MPRSLCFGYYSPLVGLELLSLPQYICSGCILLLGLYFERSWRGGCGQGMVCVSSLGELVLLRSVASLSVCGHYRWHVQVLL